MKHIAGIIVAIVMGAGMALPVLAASPSQTQCEASGGTFTKVNGTDTCTSTTHVGNSTNSATATSTDSGQGNTGNKTTSTCSGPGNSTSHC